jgi:hypothetical protein
LFSIRPERSSESPFNIRGIKSSVTTREIIETLREVRAEPVAGGDATR